MATFGNLETDVEPLAGLMREHTEIHALVTATGEALGEAIAAPGDPALAAAALAHLRTLADYMAEPLVFHIAKEEEVLFPALRGFAAGMDQVVDEMVEQHDEVREREAAIERALAALGHTHDELAAAQTDLAQGAQRIEDGDLSPAALEELLDAVKRLDWILQGHFGDEEDDLFVPALALLSPETFAALAEQAAALDA